MAKPRIIIADTDSSYIIPLQLRFVEEFFDKIDLEIITEKEFFESTFAAPQKAEIVIVSEDLYNASLQKHNIGKIFVMMEQYREEQTDELSISKIFKYTSIKEIFNEIIGKSAEALKIASRAKKEPQIVVVFSATGGVGKTTIALGMAGCLTQNYKRVLYINASWLQSFHRALRNDTAIVSPDIYAKLVHATDSAYEDIKHLLRKEVFTYLPPFKAALVSMGMKYSIYESIAVSAKRSDDYDYIIIDADTGFDDEKVSLIDAADKVVIVTKQNAASVFATNCLVSNMNDVGTEKYVFICNDYKKDEDNALVSPETAPKFSISEYINHINHYDSLRADEFPLCAGMNKASILVL